MSLHYFLDGYNVIRSSDRLATGALRDQRERLLRFIEEKRPCGSGRNRVTVVFDGQRGVSRPQALSWVEIVFSQGQTADDVIKGRVDGLANPRVAVVVSDDRAIQRWVRGVGARLMSCRDFLAAVPGGRSPGPARPEKIDSETAQDINEELKQLWKLK